MPHTTAHVRDNNTATLVCPSCGVSKLVDTGSFRHGRHTINVRCICQHEFTVLLDFRRNYRKPTSLPGTYVIISEGGVGGGIIHVNNISRGGVGFTVSGIHRIEPGQELRIEFQLNDKNKTVLKKHAVVVSVRENMIGCAFIFNAEMDKALGFYLQT